MGKAPDHGGRSGISMLLKVVISFALRSLLVLLHCLEDAYTFVFCIRRMQDWVVWCAVKGELSWGMLFLWKVYRGVDCCYIRHNSSGLTLQC